MGTRESAASRKGSNQEWNWGEKQEEVFKHVIRIVRRYEVDDAGRHYVMSQLLKYGTVDTFELTSVHYGIDLMIMDRLSLLEQDQRLIFLKVVSASAFPEAEGDGTYRFDLQLSNATLNLMLGKQQFAVVVPLFKEVPSEDPGELLGLFWFNGADLEALNVPRLVKEKRTGTGDQSFFYLSGRISESEQGQPTDLRLGASDKFLRALPPEGRFSMEGLLRAMGWKADWESLGERNVPFKRAEWAWPEQDFYQKLDKMLFRSSSYDTGNGWEHYVVSQLILHSQKSQYDVFHKSGGDYGIDLVVLDRMSLKDRPRLIFVQVKSVFQKSEGPKCTCDDGQEEHVFKFYISAATLNLMKAKHNFVLLAVLHEEDPNKSPLPFWFNGLDLAALEDPVFQRQEQQKRSWYDNYSISGCLTEAQDGQGCKHLWLQVSDGEEKTDPKKYRTVTVAEGDRRTCQRLRADAPEEAEQRMFSIEGLYEDQLPQEKAVRRG